VPRRLAEPNRPATISVHRRDAARVHLEAVLTALKRQKWLLFLVQQAVNLLVAMAFLKGMRALTGKTLHAAHDPPTLLEGAAILALWGATAAFTVWFYRASEGAAAPALGLSPRGRALGAFALGTALAFVIAFSPTLLGLWCGRLRVTDRLTTHLGPAAATQAVLVGLVFLLGNSLNEEIVSRAYPLRLFRRHRLAVRLLVPALFFAVLHLADERFSAGAFYARTIGGLAFGAGYAFTGDIWLASGLHTGWNLAELMGGGQWHIGAPLLITGTPFGQRWLQPALWTVFTAGELLLLWRRRWRVPGDEAKQLAR